MIRQPYVPMPNRREGHIHLRGVVTDMVVDGRMVRTGKTSCGLTITKAMHVPGLPGFRLAYGTSPKSVCLTCLDKSRTMKTPK